MNVTAVHTAAQDRPNVNDWQPSASSSSSSSSSSEPFGNGSNMIWVVPMIGYLLYFLFLVVGIPANLFVLFRMLHFKRSSGELYRNGAGICLLTMAACDLVALGSLASLFSLSLHAAIDEPLVYQLLCKLSIFGLHSVTSIAIWSWLLMSILRWLALRRPLYHRTLYHVPSRALSVVCAVSFSLNAFLLLTVRYDHRQNACTQNWLLGSLPLTRAMLLVEMGWSFVVPILVVAYLDVTAFCSLPRLLRRQQAAKILLAPPPHAVQQQQHVCCTRANSTNDNSNGTSHHHHAASGAQNGKQRRTSPESFALVTSQQQQQQQHHHHYHQQQQQQQPIRNAEFRVSAKSRRVLVRWLAIALVDILLNTPENVRRLSTIIGITGSTVQDEAQGGMAQISFLSVLLRTVSDVMYYSQYAFNAVFLAIFIYDKCTWSKSSAACSGVPPVSTPRHTTTATQFLATAPSSLRRTSGRAGVGVNSNASSTSPLAEKNNGISLDDATPTAMVPLKEEVDVAEEAMA